MLLSAHVGLWVLMSKYREKSHKIACNIIEKIVYDFLHARESHHLERFSEFGGLISPAEFEESIPLLT